MTSKFSHLSTVAALLLAFSAHADEPTTWSATVSTGVLSRNMSSEKGFESSREHGSVPLIAAKLSAEHGPWKGDFTAQYASGSVGAASRPNGPSGWENAATSVDFRSLDVAARIGYTFPLSLAHAISITPHAGMRWVREVENESADSCFAGECSPRNHAQATSRTEAAVGAFASWQISSRSEVFVDAEAGWMLNPTWRGDGQTHDLNRHIVERVEVGGRYSLSKNWVLGGALSGATWKQDRVREGSPSFDFTATGRVQEMKMMASVARSF